MGMIAKATVKPTSHKDTELLSYAIDNEDGTGEIFIYDAIFKSYWFDGIDSESVQRWLTELADCDKITVHINSPGGAVFEGNTIYSLLAAAEQEITVRIEGLCASIATVIACAGDHVQMAESALYMIHDPMGCACGGSADMKKMADLLDKVKKNIVSTYEAKTNQSDVQLAGWMTEETWFDSAQAKEHGFVDEIIPNKTGKGKGDAEDPEDLAARFGAELFDQLGFRNTPKNLLDRKDRQRPMTKTPSSKSPETPQQPATQPDNSAGQPPTNPTTPQQPETPTASASASTPATAKQIKAACPGADAEWIMAQLEADNDIEACRTNWMHEQNRRLQEAQNKSNDGQRPSPGVQALGGKGKTEWEGDDPQAAWKEGVDAKVKAGKSRRDAIRAMVKEEPELYAAYLEAHNAAHANR